MLELVSILIPAYNAEKWIKQTIESALGQTWENKEVIIVDDGSTDKTLALAKEFDSKSVKIVTQNNRGASSARNMAFALSNGDFIQWLDADDLLAPDKILQQMKVAHNGKTNRILYSSPYGVFYHRIKKAKFVPSSLWQSQKTVDWLLRSFNENLWMHPASWLASRKLTDSAGPWDERLSMDDDGEYFARVLVQSENITFVKEARSYYRHSSFSQISRNFSEKALHSFFLATTLRIQYLLSIEDSDRTRKASLVHLQTILPFFCAESPDLVQQIYALALNLGGELAPPVFDWRSNLLNKLIGPKNGNKLMTSFRKLRLATAVTRDKIMLKLGR